MTEYILCENCPWNDAHEILRMVDPTIVGCNFFLVGCRTEETVIVHEVERGERNER